MASKDYASMSNEQPHVEVLSRNRINRSTIIVALPFTIAGAAVLVMTVLPHLGIIWLMIEFVAAVAAIVASAYALRLIAGWYIELREQWFKSRTMPATEHGIFDLERRQHLPALPAPSVQVSEVAGSSAEKQEPAWHDIVNRHFHQGQTYQEIEAATGMKKWKVQEICADWKKKVSGSN